jgi:hypothetical protein
MVLHGVLLEYLFIGGVSREKGYREEADNSVTHVNQLESICFHVQQVFSRYMVGSCPYNFYVSRVI